MIATGPFCIHSTEKVKHDAEAVNPKMEAKTWYLRSAEGAGHGRRLIEQDQFYLVQLLKREGLESRTYEIKL